MPLLDPLAERPSADMAAATEASQRLPAQVAPGIRGQQQPVKRIAGTAGEHREDLAAMVVEFIVETYGLDKLQAILIEQSQYPRYESGYSNEREPEMQQRLYQSIETVLGLSKNEFNQQWLAWISSQ